MRILISSNVKVKHRTSLDTRCNDTIACHNILMMEAGSTSETSVNFYQITRRNIPKDSDLHTRRLENLKSHLKNIFSDFLFCVTLSF
jgi:hypothetical protein